MMRREWRFRRFTAEGCSLQKMVRLAAEEEIALKGMKHPTPKNLTGLVGVRDSARLAELAARGGWRLTLAEDVGWERRVKMLKRRWLLLTALALGLCAAGVAMQLVWSVEIVDAGPYEADVRVYLEQAGVLPFRWRGEINPAALKDALEWRYPRVAWVECGWRGTSLSVRLIRGVPMVTESEGQACDLVAERGGVVVSVIALAGTPKVKAGQVVAAGDVLIAGEERTAKDQLREVAARGEVLARAWDAASVRMSLWERETVYTGRTQTAATVACPLFDLLTLPESGFAQQDTAVEMLPLGGVFLPFTWRRETRMEAEISPQRCDMEELKAQAGLAAFRALRTKVGADEIFVDKWVDYSMIEDDYLTAQAVGERIVDLSRKQPRTTSPT